MTEAPISLHPDDGDIIRLMDDAVPAPERVNLENHFATCASCRARRAVLARRTERLAGLLRATDEVAPATPLRAVVRRRQGRSTVAWRIAATVLLVLGASSAVTPVRAWFAEVAKTVLARFGGSTKAVASPDGSVSFVPASSRLTIRIPNRAGASLAVEIVDGDHVTASDRGSDVLVLPEELRFSDKPGATGDYVVRAPLRMEVIQVMIGTGSAQVLRPKAIGDRWVIALDPPGK